MDTREKIQQNAATIEFAALLMESVKLFTEKSNAFQAALLLPENRGAGVYMHLKVAYELGALFNSIISQLMVLDPRHNSEMPSILYSVNPAPLKWNDKNSYEWRLLKAVIHPNALMNQISDLPELHACINKGIESVIATPFRKWSPETIKSRGKYFMVRLTPEQKGGTRRRKRGPRRN